MADIFISYSRKDIDFARVLHEALSRSKYDAWIDWQDIALTADWWEEIKRGIESTDSFVFVISPDSIQSKVCRREIEHATAHNKRLVPIVRRQGFDKVFMHEGLSRHNWIMFREQDDFDQAFQSLVQAINLNLPYVRAHTRLLTRALEWEQAHRRDDLLLRGQDLLEAEQWLESAIAKKQEPKVAEQHRIYLDKSRDVEEANRRLLETGKQARRLKRVGATVLGLTLAVTAGTGVVLLQAYRHLHSLQIQSAVDRANLAFRDNPDRFDALLLSLQAGHQLQQTRLLQNRPELGLKVVEALTQAVFWVKEVNRLEGHTDTVNGVSFSPDGQTIATASFDGTAKIWKSTGQEITTLEGHTDTVTGVSFSPKGDLLATASFDQTARLWTPKGEEVATLKGHTATIWGASFSPDGQTVATASEDGTVKFWNLEGQALPIVLQGGGGGIYTVSFSPDGQSVATGNADGTIELWDRAGNRSGILNGPAPIVTQVSYIADGRTLASASTDGIAFLWNLESLDAEPIALVGHEDIVQSIVFSPDNQYVATASNDGTVKVWNRQGFLLETLNGHEGRVLNLSFRPIDSSTPGQLILASASTDKTVRLWQLGPGKAQILSGHPDDIYAVSYSSDGQFIATSDRNGQIFIWNNQGKKIRVISSLNGAGGSVNGLDFSPKEQLLASASSSGVAHIWDMNGTLISSLKGHTDIVLSVSFSPSGQNIATSSYDGTAKLWDIKGNLLTEMKGHTNGVQKVVFSNDGKFLATASEDGTVKVWNQSGQIIHSFDAASGSVYSVVFSPDNLTVAASGADNLTRVWDLAKPDEPIAVLEGHTAPVWSIALSPDGQRIATASDDGAVKLWQKDGTLITTFKGHSQGVYAVDFNQDGTAFVTGGADDNIIVWDISNISLDQLMEEGCGWVRDYPAQRRTVSGGAEELPTTFCSL
ncbi:TIR domain-containing protein [Nodosilinea sp. LEGE 07298]|uniref:WD40 domain-containing protein n=1 Tax=Nodosilinea sp. LEGE 07298 TaxID=2777970 RepID=UPI00187E4586|nr:TIR domain-containing protein [Nodosilinea sp. LEGE 07298]MBE9108795.1 TIR domain-containing protein [Nodosilinea sp. LEGE 07298]